MITTDINKIVNTISAVIYSQEVKTAVNFISPTHVVKATRKGYKFKNGKPDRFSAEIILTIGKPNYAEREYIKKLKKVKEPFPVKKILLKHFA